MNRAFVSENDGWKRCRHLMEDCLLADEQGECTVDRCRQDPGFIPPKGRRENDEASEKR